MILGFVLYGHACVEMYRAWTQKGTMGKVKSSEEGEKVINVCDMKPGRPPKGVLGPSGG